MNHPTLLVNSPNQEIWENLKQAITLSSGFQRWQQEQISKNFSLEEQIRLYLQDTLTTLAY